MAARELYLALINVLLIATVVLVAWDIGLSGRYRNQIDGLQAIVVNSRAYDLCQATEGALPTFCDDCLLATQAPLNDYRHLQLLRQQAQCVCQTFDDPSHRMNAEPLYHLCRLDYLKT